MSRDLRQYSRQTIIRLIIGGFIAVFIVGNGLIYIIFGPEAALTGFTCMLGGLFPIIAILAIFYFFDFIIRRFKKD